jgi:hypothetical protein
MAVVGKGSVVGVAPVRTVRHWITLYSVCSVRLTIPVSRLLLTLAPRRSTPVYDYIRAVRALNVTPL